MKSPRRGNRHQTNRFAAIDAYCQCNSNCTADDKLVVCNAIEAEQQDEKTKMIDMHYEGSDRKENVPHTHSQIICFSFSSSCLLLYFSLDFYGCWLVTYWLSIDRWNERTSSNHLRLSIERVCVFVFVLYRNVCDMAIAASVSNCTQSMQFLIAQLRWCALSYRPMTMAPLLCESIPYSRAHMRICNYAAAAAVDVGIAVIGGAFEKL